MAASMAGLLLLQLPSPHHRSTARFPSLPVSRCPSLAPQTSSKLRIVALKPDIYKAMGTALQTANDVLEAGTKLVPESIPRSLARAGVAGLGVLALSYVVQSLFSLALFILVIGGIGYYTLFYLNKDNDEGGSGGGGGNLSNSSDTDLTLEEARRIMEKYKE